MNYTTTQEAFMVIERLAALVATQGVNEKTQEIANEQIQKILESVVKPAVTTMLAKSSGLVI